MTYLINEMVRNPEKVGVIALTEEWRLYDNRGGDFPEAPGFDIIFYPLTKEVLVVDQGVIQRDFHYVDSPT